jgi:hypothetical protein
MAAGQEVLPPEDVQALAALDEAKRQIDVARAMGDTEKLLEVRDTMAAFQHYWKLREDARDIVDSAGEVKVRAEAALGKLDIQAAPSSRGGRRKTEDEEEEAVVPPLADFQPNRRSMFRTLGRLEAKQLDTVVEGLRAEDDGGVTTSRAVRAARELLPVEHRESATPAEKSKEARRELVADYVAHMKALDTETNLLTRQWRKVTGVAKPGERARMASRLGNTIARLTDLQEAIEVDAEPSSTDVEED